MATRLMYSEECGGFSLRLQRMMMGKAPGEDITLMLVLNCFCRNVYSREGKYSLCIQDKEWMSMIGI